MKNGIVLLCLLSGMVFGEPIIVTPTSCSQGMNFPDGSQIEDRWCTISAAAEYRILEDGYLLEIEGFATSTPPAGDPMNWMIGTAEISFAITTDEHASETGQIYLHYDYEQSGFVQGIENNVLCCNAPFPATITVGAWNGGNQEGYDSHFKMSVRADLLVWQEDGQFTSHPIRPFLVDTELRGSVEAFAVLSPQFEALGVLSPQFEALGVLSPQSEALAVLAPEPAAWQLLSLGASVFAFIQLRRSRGPIR
jgi:hypothetical protein